MPQYAPMVIKGRGGALPQYQGGNSVYAPGQGVSARVDDSSIGIRLRGSEAAGQGMDMLARAIDSAGRTAGAIADQYGRLKGLQAYRGYVEEMTDALYNKDYGLLNTKGEAAFDVERRIREKQQELHKKYIGDGAGSIFGIGMYFNQAAYDYDMRTYQQGVQHSAQAYNRWVPAQHLANADTYYEQAMRNSANPEEYQRYMRAAETEIAMAGRFQGQGWAEIGVQIRKGRHDVENRVMRGYFATGNYDAAARALGRGGYGEGGVAGTGHTIAEDHRNPLNLKRVGANRGDRSDFRVFGSYAQGFIASWDQLKLYQNRDGLRTPKAMVAKWAPASAGNKHGAYFRNMAAGGLSKVDSDIDVNDPRQAAVLLKAMATAEGPVGKMFSVEEIERMITTGETPAGKEGSGAAGAWTPTGDTGLGEGDFGNLTEEERGHYGAMLDARARGVEEQRRKAAEEAKKVDHANAVSAGVQAVNDLLRVMPRDATQEEKAAEAAQYISNALPEELRAEVTKAVADQLQVEDAMHNAEAAKVEGVFRRTVMGRDGSWQAKMDAIRQAQPQDYTTDMVAFGRAQEKALKACEEIRDGKANAKDSRANLAEFYRWYDSQISVDPNRVYEKLFNTNLNSADYAKAEEYRGMEAAYPFSRIEPLIDQVLGKGRTTDSEKMAIYESVRHDMGSSQWDDERIREAIRVADTKTSGGDSLYEVPAGQHVDIDVSPLRMDRAIEKLEAGYAGWQSLPRVAKDVLAKALVFRETYHRAYVPSEKERKELDRTLPNWNSELEKIQKGGA